MVDTPPRPSRSPRRGLRRPRVVIAVLATLALSAAGVGTAFATGIGNAPAVDTVGDVDFVRPLAVPALPDRVIRLQDGGTRGDY